MKLVYEFTPNQIERIFELYRGEWWSKNRTRQETIDGIKGSQICIGAIDEKGILQGFCRILTDFTFKALIFDLIVSPQYREAGVGNKLMLAIKEIPQLAKVKHFELYCIKELEPFYEKHGFSGDVGGINLMRLTND